jgi:hypothetical protein
MTVFVEGGGVGTVNCSWRQGRTTEARSEVPKCESVVCSGVAGGACHGCVSSDFWGGGKVEGNSAPVFFSFLSHLNKNR